MSRSQDLFNRGQTLMPGGVSSPVRSFGAVGGNPVFIESGSGSRVTDVDGRTYIDLLGSWGPLVLGHAHPAVVAAVTEAASRGTSFGAPVEDEIALAALITGAIDSIEMVRFVSSGTEAAMSALRLARAATGRSKVLKFQGCYHGHADPFLVAAGSGPATLGLPDSPGVTPAVVADTIVCPFNAVEPVTEAFGRWGSELAAVIVEPVAANMGVVPPAPGFLEALREMSSASGALLIFDEVVTGFRVGWQGAQGMLRISPDLTILGKIIGGGFPVGAYGGRRDLMEMIAPAGPVYQAGTLSGNPVGMVAGLATLGQLKDQYGHLEELGARLSVGLEMAGKRAGIDLTVQRVGSMLTAFFNADQVFDLDAARKCDHERFGRFFRSMLESGIYWPPSQFEAAFVSTAHTAEDIDQVIEAAGRSLESL